MLDRDRLERICNPADVARWKEAAGDGGVCRARAELLSRAPGLGADTDSMAEVIALDPQLLGAFGVDFSDDDLADTLAAWYAANAERLHREAANGPTAKWLDKPIPRICKVEQVLAMMLSRAAPDRLPELLPLAAAMARNAARFRGQYPPDLWRIVASDCAEVFDRLGVRPLIRLGLRVISSDDRRAERRLSDRVPKAEREQLTAAHGSARAAAAALRGAG